MNRRLIASLAVVLLYGCTPGTTQDAARKEEKERNERQKTLIAKPPADNGVKDHDLADVEVTLQGKLEHAGAIQSGWERVAVTGTGLVITAPGEFDVRENSSTKKHGLKWELFLPDKQLHSVAEKLRGKFVTVTGLLRIPHHDAPENAAGLREYQSSWGFRAVVVVKSMITQTKQGQSAKERHVELSVRGELSQGWWNGVELLNEPIRSDWDYVRHNGTNVFIVAPGHLNALNPALVSGKDLGLKWDLFLDDNKELYALAEKLKGTSVVAVGVLEIPTQVIPTRGIYRPVLLIHVKSMKQFKGNG